MSCIAQQRDRIVDVASNAAAICWLVVDDENLDGWNPRNDGRLFDQGSVDLCRRDIECLGMATGYEIADGAKPIE